MYGVRAFLCELRGHDHFNNESRHFTGTALQHQNNLLTHGSAIDTNGENKPLETNLPVK